MPKTWASSALRRAVAATLLMSATWPAGARAQDDEVDDATRNAARELATEAAAALAKGEKAKAQDLYRRAYALLPAPTLSVREGRVLEQLGRLVEAAEAYVRTVRKPLSADAPEPYRAAVTEANDALVALRPRIPKLTVTVEGVDRRDKNLAVSLDGKPMARALVGVPAPVDPGEHVVVAEMADGRRATGKVTLAERETKTLRLELGAAPKTPGAAPPAGNAVITSERSPNDASASDGSTQRLFAYAALGAGAVGVGVGVATGLMATSRHSDAEAACPGGRCPEGSGANDDIDAFRSLRTVSTVGYIVGAVGIGAGVTLLLTAPQSPPTAARVNPVIGPGFTGVEGRF